MLFSRKRGWRWGGRGLLVDCAHCAPPTNLSGAQVPNYPRRGHVFETTFENMRSIEELRPFFMEEIAAFHPQILEPLVEGCLELRRASPPLPCFFRLSFSLFPPPWRLMIVVCVRAPWLRTVW